ncbi:MAG: DUF4388 domain-containing protein [Polyangiaceae bacterium]|nr:DUF4388 domain-containing protein [Polyangiaceae bacterium]
MKSSRDELIRIDSKGVAHPIGVRASQGMRAREGAFRMMPSPPHVVFLRLTGEDGTRDAVDGRVVRLAGELTTPGAICDVLALLGQAGWRGELIVADTAHTRAIYFDQGNVVGVHTTCDEERLGMVLYRYGAISREQLDEIVEKMNWGMRFGEAAAEVGALTHEKLYQYIGRQVEDVFAATIGVSDGAFYFLEGFDDDRLVSRHTVSVNALLMDGVTRMDEMRYFRQKVPAPDYVPVKNEGAAPPPAEFAKTYDAIDGKASVEDIGRVNGKGEFGTTKDLYALVQSKHVTIHPPRATGGPAGLVTLANSALRVIHTYADRVDKGQALRSSLASFAVGAGVYEMLFRGAGPSEEGVLDAKVVADNVVIVASGSDPENILKQMLHEYVSFALFSAGTAIGSGKEGELKKEVGPLLAKLRPQA